MAEDAQPKEVGKKIRKAIHDSVLAKDRERAEALKYLLSLLEGERLRKGRLDEKEAVKILQTEMKKKKEALSLFKRGKREDLVEKEEREIKLLEEFLPKQASDEEIRMVVKEVVASEEKRDFNLIMGKVMGKLAGRADGNQVVSVVREVIGD